MIPASGHFIWGMWRAAEEHQNNEMELSVCGSMAADQQLFASYSFIFLFGFLPSSWS